MALVSLVVRVSAPIASAVSNTTRSTLRWLTVGAIAGEALTTWTCVLWVARAVQRRRPRIAVGCALVVAGSVARLRAAAAEPLR
jgi:hypothetical protein